MPSHKRPTEPRGRWGDLPPRASCAGPVAFSRWNLVKLGKCLQWQLEMQLKWTWNGEKQFLKGRDVSRMSWSCGELETVWVTTVQHVIVSSFLHGTLPPSPWNSCLAGHQGISRIFWHFPKANPRHQSTPQSSGHLLLALVQWLQWVHLTESCHILENVWAVFFKHWNLPRNSFPTDPLGVLGGGVGGSGAAGSSGSWLQSVTIHRVHIHTVHSASSAAKSVCLVPVIPFVLFVHLVLFWLLWLLWLLSEPRITRIATYEVTRILGQWSSMKFNETLKFNLENQMPMLFVF